MQNINEPSYHEAGLLIGSELKQLAIESKHFLMDPQ